MYLRCWEKLRRSGSGETGCSRRQRGEPSPAPSVSSWRLPLRPAECRGLREGLARDPPAHQWIYLLRQTRAAKRRLAQMLGCGAVPRAMCVVSCFKCYCLFLLLSCFRATSCLLSSCPGLPPAYLMLSCQKLALWPTCYTMAYCVGRIPVSATAAPSHNIPKHRANRGKSFPDANRKFHCTTAGFAVYFKVYMVSSADVSTKRAAESRSECSAAPTTPGPDSGRPKFTTCRR